MNFIITAKISILLCHMPNNSLQKWVWTASWSAANKLYHYNFGRDYPTRHVSSFSFQIILSFFSFFHFLQTQNLEQIVSHDVAFSGEINVSYSFLEAPPGCVTWAIVVSDMPDGLYYIHVQRLERIQNWGT